MSALAIGKKEEPYKIKDDYLLYSHKLCVTCSLLEKIMYESHAPLYVGHRGILATLKRVELYFYWPHIKADIQAYVSTCMVCQKKSMIEGSN